MKFHFTQLLTKVLTLEGKTIPVAFDGQAPQDLTIQHAIRTALIQNFRDDPEESRVDDKQKFDDYDLAKAIIQLGKDDTVEISSERIVRIKKLALKYWGKEVGGFVRDYLEGKIDPPLIGQNKNTAVNKNNKQR